MKKLLFVFVLGAFAACGSGSTTATTDSTTVTSGSMSTDSTSTGSTMGADSTHH